MSEEWSNLKVAAVQASPVFLNKEGSVGKACRLIKEAGEEGAEIIVFPEGFIPTHPIWYHFHEGTGPIATELSKELFNHSIEIPGPEVSALAKAAAEVDAYVIMGACEKLPGSTGTMYNTQIYIGPDGKYLGKHQKIMPTVGERFVHAGGFGDTFGTIQTKFGPMSALMCSENSNPLAISALTSQSTRIHGMSWPNHWGKAVDSMKENVKIATLNFAQVSKAFVISACSVVDEEMIAGLQLSEEDKKLFENPEFTGGSMIASPEAKLIAGPLGNEEGILYADINLEECVIHKLHHDFSGHYNRPDIFQLYINKSAPKLYNEIEERTVGYEIQTDTK